MLVDRFQKLYDFGGAIVIEGSFFFEVSASINEAFGHFFAVGVVIDAGVLISLITDDCTVKMKLGLLINFGVYVAKMIRDG